MNLECSCKIELTTANKTCIFASNSFDLLNLLDNTRKKYSFEPNQKQELCKPINCIDCHLCLFHLPVQKIFLPRSNFFEHVQYFLNTVKFFDHGQKQDFTL